MENKNRQISRRAKAGVLFIGTGLALVISYNACTQSGLGTGSVQALSGASSVGTPGVKMNMSIISGGSTIYSDTNASATLTLKSGTPYTMNINPQGTPPAGAIITVTLKNTDVPNSTPIVLAMNYGANSFSVANAGDYQISIVETAQGMNTVTQAYSASIICPNPVFTSVAGTTMSVSGADDVYTFTPSVSGNGTAPYLCALDPSGVGIVDSAFQPCTQAFTSAISPYVAQRKVGLIVKDSCNIAVTTSVALNLSYSVPAIPSGMNFISGLTSAATGSAVGDARDVPVQYFDINKNPHVPCQAMFQTGSFSIQCTDNYSMAASANFGMGINLTGVTGTFDPSNPATWATGTISATNETIQSITYSTDQAGDALPAQVFTGKTCTLTNQGIKTIVVNGTPCTASDGSSHTGNTVTVENWGDYTCTGLTLTPGSASIAVSGVFDGLYQLTDSCTGGGQGQGGQPPIKL